jgi:hypothetical protein
MSSKSKVDQAPEPWDAEAKRQGIEVSPDFPFYVTEEEDDSLTFRWDPNHSVTHVFNTWTEQDFSDCLIAAANEVLQKHQDK